MRIANVTLSTKCNDESRLQTILKNLSYKNSMALAQSRYVDQGFKTEDTSRYPHRFNHLIFETDAKRHAGRKTTSSTNVAGKIGSPCSSE